MICKCFYTFRCPAFGLKSLRNGCALCMCCFCIVIWYCSIKIIKYWWRSSKRMIFKKRNGLLYKNGFAWGTSYPEKVAIIPSSIILWNFHVLFSPPQSFPILSNFEAKICTECACMVYVLFLHYYFILFHQNHRNNKNYISEDTCLKKMFSLQNGCAYPLGLCKMGVRAPMVSIFMFMFFSFSRKAGVALMVMMLSYLLWFASVSTHSGVLLSDWSLYTMGVHCVCVVFALLLNIVPVKSSNTDEDHLSIWYLKKKKWFSLQNGFAWGTSYPEKVAIIPSSIFLWNFHVLFSPPESLSILSNFEQKSVRNARAWCMCCFCIVIS